MPMNADRPQSTPVVAGKVIRNVHQTGWDGSKSWVRLDVKDAKGAIHIYVPANHPLADAHHGAEITIVKD